MHLLAQIKTDDALEDKTIVPKNVIHLFITF